MRSAALFAFWLLCGDWLSAAANVSNASSAVSETSAEDKHAQKVDDDKGAKVRELQRRFREAKSEAASALDEIEKLCKSFKQNTTQDAVDERVGEFAKRAARAMDERRNELVQQFLGNFSVALKAAAEARSSAKTNNATKSSLHRVREQARSALSNMRHLDGQLRRAEHNHVETMRRDSEELSRMARKQARLAESEGDRLVRLVRHRGDRLDELARKEGKNSDADQLERKANEVMRTLENEAEEGARRVDDKVRDLADHIARDVYAKVMTHQEIRDTSMDAVAESLLAVADQHQQFAETSTSTAAVAAFAGALLGGLGVALAMQAVTGRPSSMQL